VAVGDTVILSAPLNTDRPDALRRLVSGSMLLGVAAIFVGLAVAGLFFWAERTGPITVADFICPGILAALALTPVLMGLTGVLGRRCTVHPRTELPDLMQPLHAIRWPIRRLARAPVARAEVETLWRAGVRAVVDLELAEWARSAEVPAGLIEPVALNAARPIGGCRTSLDLTLLILVCLIVAPGLLLGISTGLGNATAITAVVLLLLGILLLIARSIIRLPSMQRRMVDVPVLGTWARGGIRRLGAVAGPGWVRLGTRVWQAERDILLIRRRGCHAVGTSLEVMLIGHPGRLRFVIAGTGDPMLQRLWSAWMCPEVRPDLATTELSAAVG
jgi:hypothetical protein